jgi:hypothetical protein
MSFVGKKLKNIFGDLLQIDNGNSGISSTPAQIKDGKGSLSSLYLSTAKTKIKPGLDSTENFIVYDAHSNPLLKVDSNNDVVKLGINQVVANTQYQDFGLYDFSPTAGVHNPLTTGSLITSASGVTMAEDVSMFGSGDDPATDLDLSADGTANILMACLWYITDPIVIDEAKVFATADGSSNLLFHLFSYTIDLTTNKGDLSDGTLLAHNASALACTATTVASTTLTRDSSSIATDRVVLAFVESDATDDVSCKIQCTYHLT